jgi:hypothetical protein
MRKGAPRRPFSLVQMRPRASERSPRRCSGPTRLHSGSCRLTRTRPPIAGGTGGRRTRPSRRRSCSADPRHEDRVADSRDVVVVAEERDVAVAELLVLWHLRRRRDRLRRRPRTPEVAGGRVLRLDSDPGADGDTSGRVVLDPPVRDRNGAEVAAARRIGRAGRRVVLAVLPDHVQLAGVRIDVGEELMPHCSAGGDPGGGGPARAAVQRSGEVELAVAADPGLDRSVRAAGRRLRAGHGRVEDDVRGLRVPRVGRVGGDANLAILAEEDVARLAGRRPVAAVAGGAITYVPVDEPRRGGRICERRAAVR